ncbi:Ig-like domain repeat protein [Tunturiibacter gelidiferens]|uniref:Ig-like domain repeat protein n=1 Tax=Tunturiibacter gelidiferens TaxID=3069689 RepID=UPI003D9B2B5B
MNAAVYQPNSTNPIPGTYVYSPAIGTNLTIGNQPLSVTFTPTDTSDYTTATKTISLVVTQAGLIIEADSFTRLYGTPNPTFTGNVTGQQDGDTFVETFSNTAALQSNPGQYPIVPSVNGANLSDYTQTVQAGNLTITKAPALTTLSLSTTAIAYALPVTFTANVASTTTGQPTGTVVFFDNGNPLNTATLSSGVASFSTTSLSVGVHTITAVYSGDIDFSSSTASAASGANTITIAPLDFTITLTSAQTVEGTYGTTRLYNFHVSPVGGYYPGTINLSASPTGPILATYTFSPSTIAQFAGPTDITLTVATRKLASLDSPQDRSRRLSHIALGLFLLPLLGLRYSRRSSRKLTRLIIHSLLILSSLGAIGTITGCGAGYFDRTYPIVVTANSNGIQHTVNVDFHIDQSPQ